MQDRNESELVKELLLDKACLFDALFFATMDALADEREPRDCWVHIATEVPRGLLGLAPGRKPGDIDLLIIPEKEDGPIFSNTIAVEVKVVRPTLAKPDKNSDKMGGTQVRGLEEDGFPFVGLLHLEVPEVSPDAQKVVMPNGFMMDMFPFEAAIRQEGRLRALNLAGHIGYSSTGLAHNSRELLGSTFGFEQSARRSPRVKGETIHAVKNFFHTQPEKFVKLQWVG